MSADDKLKETIKELFEILPRLNWYSLITSGHVLIIAWQAVKMLVWGVAYALFVMFPRFLFVTIPRALLGKTDWRK